MQNTLYRRLLAQKKLGGDAEPQHSGLLHVVTTYRNASYI
jgi:hypothetical protein